MLSLSECSRLYTTYVNIVCDTRKKKQSKSDLTWSCFLISYGERRSEYFCPFDTVHLFVNGLFNPIRTLLWDFLISVFVENNKTNKAMKTKQYIIGTKNSWFTTLLNILEAAYLLKKSVEVRCTKGWSL